MKKLVKGVVLSTLAVAVVVASSVGISAQKFTAPASKPALIVSVTSINSLFEKINYLSEVAESKSAAAQAKILLNGFTAGIDKTRPLGVAVTATEKGVEPLGFIPVTDLDQLLEVLKQAGQIGEPKKVGGGVFEVTAAGLFPVFFKENNGWVFIARTPDTLAHLPAKPEQLLRGLDKQYVVSVRASLQNVPQGLRQLAITQLKNGFASSFQNALKNKGNSALAKQLQQKLAKNQFDQLVSVINDTDEITFGWSVDSKTKNTFVDFSMTAVPGSKVSRQFTSLQGLTTSFAGFGLPQSTLNLRFTTKLAEPEIQQTITTLLAVREVALQEIDKDKDLPNDEARESAQEIIHGLFDVLISTVQSGKIDGGATFVLKPNSINAVVGGYVAESAALEDTFKKLVELAKSEPKFPGVKFNAAQYAGVNFHTLTLPVPEGDDARKILGDTVTVSLGIGPQSVYLAFGQESLELTQQVIDSSTAQKGQAAAPFELKISLGSILRFAAATKPNPKVTLLANLLGSASGHDHITITALPINNGITYRLNFEEGVLKAIGQASTQAVGNVSKN